MSSSYKKQEWSAFKEADLLKAGSDNGGSIGKGDSFTMPSGATVKMSTYDNDNSLSGDNWRNENSNDHSGQYASIDGARVGSQMYAESYHVLHGSDGKTYYLIEIEVEGYNAPGKGDDFFTFYGDVPPSGVELTVKQTCNVKGCWVDYSCLGAGDGAPANTPPTFTNLPENGIICVDENTTFVIDADATDADGDALTYEIVGGRDAEFFEIDPDTGELTFIGAPDYENPMSGGDNNTYDVTIKVSDDKGGSDTKALWVKVKDVDEGNGNCIVIEAEDMNEWGFHTVSGDQASGGELVKLNCANGKGELTTTFNGATGEYDLTVYVQDEDDGQSTIKVKVNGEVVGTLTLDNDNDGGGSNNGGFSPFTLENIQINPGDTVTLWVDGEHYEFVRIDKIELCLDGEPCPDGFSLQDFSGVASGVTVADQFEGFTVTAQRNGDAPDSENDAMIFDTSNPTGGDNDLGFDNLGNAIIISEDNDASDPDDNAGGGTITFDFDNPSDLHDIKLLDIEGTGSFIELFDADGALIKKIDVVGTGDNTVQTILLDAADVAQMVVTLDTSGGVDDLCFKPGEPPAPGSLSGRYFIDDNKNDVDDGEPGVEGVLVELLNADGTGTGITTSTASDGSYSFGNLAPGTYGVKFTDAVTGLTLVDPNQGVDDTIDSDAIDVGGGMSTISDIVVVSGLDTADNDAGVVNAAPDTMDDAGMVCADEELTIDVLGNDSDPDGDSLTITAVDGQAITEGQVIFTSAGTSVQLVGGELVFDGEDAYAALDIGESAIENITYTVSDGMDTTDANVAVTFKGDANSVEGLAVNLPDTATIQLVDENDPAGSSDEAFTVQISNGNGQINGVYTEAYCISVFDPYVADGFGADVSTAPAFDNANVYLGIASEVPTGVLETIGINGETAAENLDEITWILNQDFGSQGFTDAEIQGAIWALTDGEGIESGFGLAGGIFVADGAGEAADAQLIVDMALVDGSGFEAQDGDIVGVIIDSNDPEFEQPFIVGIAYDSLDCIC